MSVQIDYALGLSGLAIAATAYADTNGDAAGVALAFTENTHRLGYYSATSSGLTIGLNWIQISASGSNFDQMWAAIPASGRVVIVPTQFEALTAVQSGDSYSRLGTPAGASVSADIATRLAASAYSSPPTAVQNRQEMDANSTKLSNLDAAVSSRLATSAYTSPPTAATIAATTAGVIFVDGAANPLKVNTDHSVSASTGTTVIQNNITIPPAVAVASQVPSLITCLRGDTLRVTLPVMGDLTTRSKIVMTAKVNVNDSDELAVFQVVEGTGLVRLNGSDAVVAGTASLTVSDATVGTVLLEIDASVTALFSATDLVWDAQAYLSTGIISPISGAVSIVADVTQAVT